MKENENINLSTSINGFNNVMIIWYNMLIYRYMEVIMFIFYGRLKYTIRFIILDIFNIFKI
jgi:hypothetical protein